MDEKKVEMELKEPQGSQNSQQPQPQPQPLPQQTPKVRPEQRQEGLYKGRLQVFTQRAIMPAPIYQTINEGAMHVPKFRSTVVVDGLTYISQNTYPHKKSAEQEAAKLALEGIAKRLREEGCPIIAKDTVFCKIILNEFAVKTNSELPTYMTVQSEGLLPRFVSSLVFDGVTYTGEASRTKKEAEQLAARAAILSFLGYSNARLILYEIIRSKFKLYAALNQFEDPKQASSVGCQGANVESHADMSELGAKRTSDVQISATLGQSSEQCVHQFKRFKPEPVCETPRLPITFVPSCQVEASADCLALCEEPKKKKNKKKRNKKKTAKLIPDNSNQMPVAALPLNPLPPCTTTQ